MYYRISRENGGENLKGNNILNRVFSKNTIQDLLINGKSDILDIAYEKHFKNQTNYVSNLYKVKELYSLLSKSYRNEYFYKNTIINKLLIGRHSINTTMALTELPLNKSKADIILINGKAVVYEIKTELDSLQRLNNQILDYYTVFDHVEVITDDTHLDKVLEIYRDSTVGISVLTKRNTISQKKEPIKNRVSLSHESIYKVLRKDERKQIVSYFYKNIPTFDQFSEYKEMFKLFRQIEINLLYDQFIYILKKRNMIKYINKQFLEVPYELKSLFYFSQIKEEDYYHLKMVLGEDNHVLPLSQRKTI